MFVIKGNFGLCEGVEKNCNKVALNELVTQNKINNDLIVSSRYCDSCLLKLLISSKTNQKEKHFNENNNL